MKNENTGLVQCPKCTASHRCNPTIKEPFDAGRVPSALNAKKACLSWPSNRTDAPSSSHTHATHLPPRLISRKPALLFSFRSTVFRSSCFKVTTCRPHLLIEHPTSQHDHPQHSYSTSSPPAYSTCPARECPGLKTTPTALSLFRDTPTPSTSPSLPARIRYGLVDGLINRRHRAPWL